MNHPARFHDRFWESMGERFGKPWFDLAGPLPTKSWRELLDQFTRDEVDAALLRLKDRPESYRANPPTYAEFQELLSAAAKNRPMSAAVESRGHWRSVVVGTCMRHAGLLGIVAYGETELGKLPSSVYGMALRRCQELQDWACDAEHREGRRTPGIEQHVNAELWNALKGCSREATP